MDLVRMTLNEKRKTIPVIVLKRAGGQWSRNEVALLVRYLKSMAIVSQLPALPEFLVIQGGEWSRLKIIQILGINDFEYNLLYGLDNPELPFTLEFYSI